MGMVVKQGKGREGRSMQTHHKVLWLSRTVPIRPRLPQLWVADSLLRFGSKLRGSATRLWPDRIFLFPFSFFFLFFPVEKSTENRVSTRNKENRAPGPIPRDARSRSAWRESILMRVCAPYGGVSFEKRRTIFIERLFIESAIRFVAHGSTTSASIVRQLNLWALNHFLMC